MNKAIKWIVAVCVIAVIFGISRLYFHLTDDFRLGNITYKNLPNQPEWNTPLPTDADRDQLNQIIGQNFTYMGKGAQSYAFVSQDQQYVLKFFKFKHLKPVWFIDYVPNISPFNHIKYNYIKNKERKLRGVFEGYHIGNTYNRDNAEIIYLHLSPTDYLKYKVTVFDKLGREHVIDLDQTVFLIQKKGEPLRDRMDALLSQGQLEEAKHALSQILAMYLSEYQRGIYDRDHGVMQNTGFIGDKPFHLDVGKMTKDDRIKDVEFYKKDLELVFWKMDLWIKTHYPRYHSDFAAFFAEQYSQMTGDTLKIDQMTRAEYKAKRR